MTWNAPAQISYPGGTLRTLTYDGLLRPTCIQVQGAAPSPLRDYRYTYDAESNILQKATEHGNYRYGYDLLYRLTQADNPSPLSSEAYTYDPLGNRLTDSRTNGLFNTHRWTYNSNNQLLQHYSQQGNPVQNDYDANGSLIKKTSPAGEATDNQQFRYDAQNRLVAVLDQAGNPLADYRYDPFGRRMAKTVYRENGTTLAAAKTTYFIYAEEGLIAEADATGTITREYGWKPQGIWGTDPVFLKSPRLSGGEAEYFYYQNDHLGTSQQLIDGTGQLVWQGKATAFGENGVQSEYQVENYFRFAGQYFDIETTLNYNKFRSYGVGTGRFIESDLIGLKGGLNTYLYVGANPNSRIDPSGTKWKCRNIPFAMVCINEPDPPPSPLLFPPYQPSPRPFPPPITDPWRETTPIITTPPNFSTKEPSNCDEKFEDDVTECKNTCGPVDVARYWCLAKAYLRYRACRRIYNPAGSNWPDEK